MKLCSRNIDMVHLLISGLFASWILSVIQIYNPQLIR